MTRTTFAAVLPLLTLLALTLSGQAVAGPPEGVSGKMVLARDEVAEGLRRYRNEKDEIKRCEMLYRLRELDDPRVAVAWGEALSDSSENVRIEAIAAIITTQKDVVLRRQSDDDWASKRVSRWWKENEANLRRRAKQLPQ